MQNKNYELQTDLC